MGSHFTPSAASQPPSSTPPGSSGGPHLSSNPVSFLREFSFARAAAPPLPPQEQQQHNHPSNKQQQQQQQQDLSVVARTSIVVSRRQQGNPVLAHIRNVRWVFGDIVPDYLLGATSCALFLSLRYHLLHPNYIFVRIRELQKSFRLRVLLCHVDVDDVIKPLHDITKTALLHECTLLCAWSPEECARYLETLKSYENKPAAAIQERTDSDYVSRATSALTSVRHVNRTDALTLCQAFGSLGAVVGAAAEELARCPGIGEKKVKRLFDTFHEPFRRRAGGAVQRGPGGGKAARLLGGSQSQVQVEGEEERNVEGVRKEGEEVVLVQSGAIGEGLNKEMKEGGDPSHPDPVSRPDDGSMLETQDPRNARSGHSSPSSRVSLVICATDMPLSKEVMDGRLGEEDQQHVGSLELRNGDHMSRRRNGGGSVSKSLAEALGECNK